MTRHEIKTNVATIRSSEGDMGEFLRRVVERSSTDISLVFEALDQGGMYEQLGKIKGVLHRNIRYLGAAPHESLVDFGATVFNEFLVTMVRGVLGEDARLIRSGRACLPYAVGRGVIGKPWRSTGL